MATLISSGNEIGFTILPYLFDKPLEEELIAHRNEYVLGYITSDRTFMYMDMDTGVFTEAKHWSLDIVKEFPYSNEKCPWIVYCCPPKKTKLVFSKILSKYHQALHIDSWDIWSVKGKDDKVSVVTSWEIF